MKKIDFYYFMYFLSYILCLSSIMFIPVSVFYIAIQPVYLWIGLFGLAWFLSSSISFWIFNRLYSRECKHESAS